MAESPRKTGGATTVPRTAKQRAQYVRPEARVRTDRSAKNNTEGGLTEAQRKAVLAEESKARSRGKESAAIIDADGKVVRRLTSRSAHNVSFAGIPNSELEDAVITHNHPGESQRRAYGNTLATRVGSPLSPQDLAFAAVQNVKEMRAVTYSGDGGGYVYSIRRPTGGWKVRGMDAVNLMNETRRAGRRMVQGNIAYYRQGNQQASRAELVAQWRTIQDMAKALGATVTRRRFTE